MAGMSWRASFLSAAFTAGVVDAPWVDDESFFAGAFCVAARVSVLPRRRTGRFGSTSLAAVRVSACAVASGDDFSGTLAGGACGALLVSEPGGIFVAGGADDGGGAGGGGAGAGGGGGGLGFRRGEF